MITCRELVSFLVDYLEDKLSKAQRATFEEHLRICDGCVDYLDSYRKTIELTHDAFAGKDPSTPAEAVPEDLVRAILAARGRSPS